MSANADKRLQPYKRSGAWSGSQPHGIPAARSQSLRSDLFSTLSPDVEPGLVVPYAGQGPGSSRSRGGHLSLHETPLPDSGVSPYSFGRPLLSRTNPNLGRGPSSQSTSSTHTQPCSAGHVPPTINRIASSFSPSPAGFFNNSHGFAITNASFSSFNWNTSTDRFLYKFLKNTIKGAAYDSLPEESVAYMAQCHPGTRLTTLEGVQKFVSAATPQHILWVVGPAGVGKTAVMRSAAAACPNLGASVFFSVNRCKNTRGGSFDVASPRKESWKVIVTIAYQLATKCKDSPYLSYLRERVSRDPSVHTKTMEVQFSAFITEPFLRHALDGQANPVAIFIDGLDECDGKEEQCDILRLISDFVAKYPSAPIVWVVASRPEPNIAEFFAALSSNIYSTIALSVSSDESLESVEKYTRDSLAKIRSTSPLLRRLQQWPTEQQILAILAAADGLFAYASTAMRFIEDLNIGNPTGQLRLVLSVADDGSQADPTGPLGPLYALYDRILDGIPASVWPLTYRLLSGCYLISHEMDLGLEFADSCELLRMPPDIAYASTHHLCSVLIVPTLDEAMNGKDLEVYHKSFWDYLDKRFSLGCNDNIEVLFDHACHVLTEAFDEAKTLTRQNITLHWPWPWDKRWDAQLHLHLLASRVIQAPLSINLTIHRILARDSSFFDNLRSMDVYGITQFDWLLAGELSDILMEEQILQEVQISVIDTSDIIADADGPCFYLEFWAEDSSQVSRRANMPAYCNQERCSWNCKDKDDGPVFYRVLYPEDRFSCGCHEIIKEDVTTAINGSPETICLMFTSKGDGARLVIYDFADPDNPAIKWKYIMPLRP